MFRKGKLYFRYGTMGSAKTALLLTMAYNFEERHMNYLCMKPAIDTREGKSVIRSRIAQTALFFGIEKLFDRKTNELSGGQKQMINLASVMVMQPQVLLLDEPVSQLDPIAAADFISAVKTVRKRFQNVPVAGSLTIPTLYF